MSEAGKVERLRRVAYGPGSTARERAEAEAALGVIAARGADEESAAALVAPSVAVAGSTDASEAVGGVDESGAAGMDDASRSGAAASVWGRSIRVGWLVPVVVTGIVVGVLGTLGVTGQFAPRAQLNGSSVASPSPSSFESESPTPGGDLVAADAWFDGPATASDAYPYAALLESDGIDPHDVRFALAGGGGWNVWVARTGTGKLCLLLANVATGNGSGACYDREQFVADGAHLGMDGRVADWYGDAVTVSSSSPSDPDAVPPIPGSGPGDVDRASEWFADSGTAYESYPNRDVLDALGIGDGDILALDSPSWESRILWLARQGATGFCLLVTDAVASTSNYACVPVDVFTASGVGIAIEGFAAYWDGESVASSG